jgi:hypothetical protein
MRQEGLMLNVQDGGQSFDDFTDFSSTRTEGKMGGRKVCLAVVTNVILTVSMVALLSFDIEEHSSKNPNLEDIYAYQLSLGILFRTFIEANLAIFKVSHTHWVNKINNFLARFSVEIYEILWNVGVNVTNNLASTVLSSARQSFIGYQYMGDATNLWKLNKINRPSPILEERDIQNLLLEPSVKNVKGQLFFGALKTVLGASCVILPYVFESQTRIFRLFLTCLGWSLATEGLGYGMTHISLLKWRTYEKELKGSDTPGLLDGNIDGPKLPWRIKACRTVAKAFQRVGAETICDLPSVITKTWIPFIPLGFFYGSIRRFTLEKFGTLTQDDLKLRASTRYVGSSQSVRTEVRVNQVATCAFFTMFTGWFTYGLIASDNIKERIEIATLMLSTLGSAGAARILDYLFKPGTHSRLFNEIIYRLLYDPYLPLILYQTLVQLTEINDVALARDSNLDWIIGLIGLANFGLLLGQNQVKSFNEQEFTPPLFRSLAISDNLYGLRIRL